MRVVRSDDIASRFEARARALLDREALALSPAARRALRVRLRQALVDLLEQGGRRVRGLTRAQFLLRLSSSYDRLIEERESAREDLRELRRELDLLTRGAGLSEPPSLEARLARALELDGLAGRLSTRTADEVVRFAAAAVRRERTAAGGPDRRETDLLRRRVAKLTGEMARLESALAHLVEQRDADPGVASIYRCVQGLAELDTLYQRKLELLREVFDANRALRRDLAA